MEKVNDLINKTTLICEYSIGATSLGWKYFTGGNIRYEKKYFNKFDDLSDYWKNIWNNFGNNWNKSRQNYRYLFDTYRLFFYGLKTLEEQYFNEQEKEGKKIFINRVDKNFFLVSSLYLYGKKCNDLIKKIDKGFWINNNLSLFSETRNKIFEHNYGPKGINGSFDIFISSIINTDGYLHVKYHNNNEGEKIYYIDYFNDLFEEQEILKNFLEYKSKYTI